MKVLRSKRAGFCMGVALALSKLDELVKKGGHVATFGPIIHNPFVLTEYAIKGVRCFSSVQEVKESLEPFYAFSETLGNHGSPTAEENKPFLNLLLRAHGVPRGTESFLKSLAPHVVLNDATCPRVKDAQNAISEATKPIELKNGKLTKAKTLLLYGDANHPEVDGLVSYAHGKYVISSNADKFLQYVKDHGDEEIVLAAQTTQDKPTFDILKEKLFSLDCDLKILETICDATRLRQEEALELASKVDAMVVVGGKESGNTKRLAEIVFSQNVPTVLVENADELQREFFTGMKVVGIIAGASTPKYLVDKAEEVLSSW